MEIVVWLIAFKSELLVIIYRSGVIMAMRYLNRLLFIHFIQECNKVHLERAYILIYILSGAPRAAPPLTNFIDDKTFV